MRKRRFPQINKPPSKTVTRSREEANDQSGGNKLLNAYTEVCSTSFSPTLYIVLRVIALSPDTTFPHLLPLTVLLLMSWVFSSIQMHRSD